MRLLAYLFIAKRIPLSHPDANGAERDLMNKIRPNNFREFIPALAMT